MTEPRPLASAALNDAITRVAPYARAALPVAVAVAVIALGLLRGAGSAILALAAAALVAAISLAWKSLQILVGDAELPADAAIGLGIAPVEDAKKREVLHALKELEYERSIGKISEEDYRVLSARYRAEAKTILRRIDAALAPARARAEAIVEAHLRGEPEPKTKKRKRSKAQAAETLASLAASQPTRVADKPALASSAKHNAVACPACESANDHDAMFCKKCGTRVQPEVAS